MQALLLLCFIAVFHAVYGVRLMPHEPKAWQAVPVQQNTSTPAQIVDTAYKFLINHTMIGTKWGLPFHFYKPASYKYGPHQWLWDSSSHMIVWSHNNVNNSIADMRTMLQMQQPNGRIPEIIFWGYQSPEDIIATEQQYSS
jgi:hypothetical protein